MNPWDERFSGEDYHYGVTPNGFLVEQSHRLPTRAEVLVPGDGEGRNGVWLADQGHRVTSVDGSAVGLDKARALAASRQVALTTLVADLGEWQPAPQSADAVVLTFVHLPPAIRGLAHRRLAQALRPGGCLILEAFHPRQLAFTSGGPKAEDMLYTLDLLRQDFAGLLAEVEAREGEVSLNEGPGHQGPGFVTRWVGQRLG